MEFYFSNNDPDYDGFSFVSIQNQNPVGDFLDGFFTDQIILSSNTDFSGSGHKSRSLLKFDDLGSKVFQKISPNDTYFVKEAIIYIYNVAGMSGSLTNSIKLGTLNSDQPQFDIVNTDWNSANSSEDWEVPGAIDTFTGDQLYETYSGSINRFDDTFILAPTNGSNLEHGWIPLRLNSKAVESWLVNNDNNKGSILVLGNENSDFAQFQFIDTFNEHSTTLYLKIQVNNTNARVSSESISSWSEKSLEEKLEPLQRYLRSK